MSAASRALDFQN